LVLLLLLTLSVLVSACGPDTSTHRLVVGMELSYPPFEMKNEQGEPAGVSVDLAHSMAKALERDLAIENIAFDGLIPALKTGRIDLILSSLTRTEERALSVDFSQTYLETGLCLLIARDSTVLSITNLDQAGRRVAVKKGTTGHTYASQHLKAAEWLVLDQEAAAVLEVAQGKADAFIYDQLSVYRHWRRHETTTRANLQPFQKERWSIAVRKGNTALLEQINDFLSDFRQNGGFERLGDQWMGDIKNDFHRLGLVFVF
jgi:polar amino acid transport system substrate-binding protein